MWEELPKSHFCAIFWCPFDYFGWSRWLLPVWLCLSCMGVLFPQALGSRALLCRQSWDWKDPPLHGAGGLELGLHPTWAELIDIKISLYCITLSQGHQKLKAIPVWNHRDNLGSEAEQQGSSLCWNKDLPAPEPRAAPCAEPGSSAGVTLGLWGFLASLHTCQANSMCSHAAFSLVNSQ